MRGSRRSSGAKAVVVGCIAAGALAVAAPAFGGAASAKPEIVAHSPFHRVPIYLDTRYSFAERAADLVSRMTLAEKASQLSTSNAPAIPRLGVPAYAWYGAETLHGVYLLMADNNGKTDPDSPTLSIVHATSFPTDLSASLTWSPNLVLQETGAISSELRGFEDKSLFGTGDNNLGSSASDYGSLFTFAPTVNLQRDPRWGRTDEGFGEDPYLVGQLGSAYIDGMQGQNLAGRSLDGYLKTVTTLKHYAVYNNESIPTPRDATSASVDDATLRDYYTSQFARIIEQSHPAGLMTAYSAINGTPDAANTYTVNTLARDTYGFRGYVTSDCAGIKTTYANPPAGHDWAPPGFTTDNGDAAAIWTNTATGTTVSGQAGGMAYALRAAGSLNCFGAGPAIPAYPIPGLRDLLGQENKLQYIQEAIDKGVLSVGVLDQALVNAFTQRFATGEFDPVAHQQYTKITKASIESPAHQALAQSIAEQSLVLLKNDKLATTGRPVLPADPTKIHKIVVLGDLADKVFLGGYSGLPTTTVSDRQGITAALQAANPGAQVVFDAAGTSTTATTPAVLSDATKADIQSADLVVEVVGTDQNTMAETMDRTTMAMPGNYDSLVEQVSALGNPNTVLVVQAAAPVSLTNVQDKVSSILFSGPNGELQGAALANVLFGKVTPGGHLSFTWYKDDSQLPAMGNYNLTPDQTGGLGRTYQYFTGTPTYPFGYGLSYTSFKYGNMNLTTQKANGDETMNVSFTVTNTGATAGSTVAQVYVATPGINDIGTDQLPIKRLRGFAKTPVLLPGQTQNINITIKASDLSFYDSNLSKEVVYPGSYLFEVGPDSATVALQAPVNIAAGAATPKVTTVTVQPDQVEFTKGQTLNLKGRNPWLADDTTPSQEPGRNIQATTADHIVEAAYSDESFADLSKVRVTYASSDPHVASVDANGVMTARHAGVTTIRVTVDGVTGTTPIVVQ